MSRNTEKALRDAPDQEATDRAQLAVGSAKLLQQHGTEARVGRANPDREHQFLDVVIHKSSSFSECQDIQGD